MVNCKGSGKQGTVCNGLIYRCVKCHKTGCDQGMVGRCTNHAFTFGQCNACGYGQRTIVQHDDKR